MNAATSKLETDRTALVVVDLQEKLLPAIVSSTEMAIYELSRS